MKRKIRIGVFGCRRGRTYIKTVYKGGLDSDMRITALCDANEDKLKEAAALCPSGRYAPKLFTDAGEFLKSGLFDAVILCNFFNEHAKYACLFLEAGISVLSETMAAATMADAVALCRAARKSKAVYMMAENYPFFRSNFELKRLYEGGTLGKLIFAEGEYVHPMSPDENSGISKAGPDGNYHWRKYLPVTYYSSHSLAPLIFITGEMPKRVVAMAALDDPAHAAEYGRLRPEAAGVMLVTTESGAVMRVNGSSYMGPKGNWYRLSCVNGGAETVRGHLGSVRVAYNSWAVPDGAEKESVYETVWAEDGEAAERCGHNGGDYWVMKYFGEALRGKRAPFPDVFTACAMSAVAILGFRSVMNGNYPYDIPDFRSEEDLKKWEQDRLSPFPPASI